MFHRPFYPNYPKICDGSGLESDALPSKEVIIEYSVVFRRLFSYSNFDLLLFLKDSEIRYRWMVS
jgi:hypothetical protein